jgi:large subunit ribosomal protein L18
LHGPVYKVAYRRRREGRTDYVHRLRLLRSGLPRAVVRRSNRYYTVQFIEFRENGDAVIASANSRELLKFGWTGAAGNTAAAYFTGLLAGLRAKKGGISEAVLDAGIVSPAKKSGVYAALAGMLEADVHIPHDEEVLPSKERIEQTAAGHCEISSLRSRLVI